MGIISKTVSVKIAAKTFKHYKSLGYQFNNLGEEIEVKVEDLPNSSHEKVLVGCEKCNKNRSIIYRDYIKAINKNGHYYCQSCARALCYANSTNKKTHKKGAGRKKGYSRSEETKEKFVATMKERYGVENPAQSPEILAKAAKTYYKNSSKECSKQQFYIYNLYNTNNSASLNYPISYYNVDICFIKEKLVCEYDGGGHFLNVVTGKITEEEFLKKEIVRFLTIKKEGYRQIRIVSSKDKLPPDQILLRMLSEARNYFLEYPNHSWIEFNIDLSAVRNAEHKDGVFYDYGELRAIKC